MIAVAPVSVAGLAALLVIASVAGGGIAFMLVRSQAPRPAVVSLAPAAPAADTAAAAQANAASVPRAGRRAVTGAFLEELDKKAKAAPQDVDAWRRLARERYRSTLVDRDQLPEAAAALDRVLELEPQDHESMRMRADVAYEARDYRAAVAAMQRYLALEPEDQKVRVELASALGFLGDIQAAKTIYLDLIEKNQELFAAHLGLGMELVSEKDEGGAIAQFHKARTFAQTPSQKSRIGAVIALAAAK